MTAYKSLTAMAILSQHFNPPDTDNEQLFRPDSILSSTVNIYVTKVGNQSIVIFAHIHYPTIMLKILNH